jgi:hypothetical protein
MQAALYTRVACVNQETKRAIVSQLDPKEFRAGSCLPALERNDSIDSGQRGLDSSNQEVE